eukprot:scaffold2366_cov159-Amphora_coffeaeformis.AAC.13
MAAKTAPTALFECGNREGTLENNCSPAVVRGRTKTVSGVVGTNRHAPWDLKRRMSQRPPRKPADPQNLSSVIFANGHKETVGAPPAGRFEHLPSCFGKRTHHCFL